MGLDCTTGAELIAGDLQIVDSLVYKPGVQFEHARRRCDASPGSKAMSSTNLQDIHDIRFLKHTYAAIADACASPDGAHHGAEMAALFLEDGIWEAPPEHGGKHVGRKAIEAFFAGLGKVAPWANHFMLNERIVVDGDTATGQWKNIVPVTYLVDGIPKAFWIFGGYRDEYTKRDGRWYFRKLSAYVERAASHADGWI